MFQGGKKVKQIKDLKISTKEGLKIKELQRFPSQEFGPTGGLQAEVWLGDHTYVGTLFQAGDGGMANFTWNGNLTTETREQIKQYVFDFLIRNDEDFGPKSKYEFMRDKTPAKINDDDFESLICILEEEYDTRKEIAKSFKKGFKSVARINQGYQFSYVQYYVSDITEKEVSDFLKKKNIAYETIDIYTSNDLALAL